MGKCAVEEDATFIGQKTKMKAKRTAKKFETRSSRQEDDSGAVLRQEDVSVAILGQEDDGGAISGQDDDGGAVSGQEDNGGTKFGQEEAEI